MSTYSITTDTFHFSILITHYTRKHPISSHLSCFSVYVDKLIFIFSSNLIITLPLLAQSPANHMFITFRCLVWQLAEPFDHAYAFSYRHMAGWLDVCLNKQMYRSSYSFQNINDSYSDLLQIFNFPNQFDHLFFPLYKAITGGASHAVSPTQPENLVTSSELSMVIWWPVATFTSFPPLRIYLSRQIWYIFYSLYYVAIDTPCATIWYLHAALKYRYCSLK